MLHDLLSDFRHALRLLRRSPRNAAIAIAVLGLGIGTNTAMFSAINHVLLRPLPFPEANRLLRLRDQMTGADGFAHPFNMSARTILAMREHTTVFDGTVAMSGDNMTLTDGDLPSRVSVVFQSDGAEQTLTIRPVLGRSFSADEQRKGIDSGVAVISYAFWQSRLGGSSAAIGSSIHLDARPFTVIGVMPPRYAFPYDAQVWLPIVLDPTDQSRDFAVWGRMRPGVTMADVRANLDAAAARIREAYPGALPGYSLEMMTMRENVTGSQDAPLRALTAVVAFLLLIACVNVSTLSLERGVARRREFAVRAALGATPARHVRQLLAESLVLGISGCAAGLVVSAWLAPMSARLIPSVLTEQLGLATLHTDWRVAAFAAAVSILCAVAVGLLPAFGSWRSEPRQVLADGGRSIGLGRGRRILNTLIIAETALTMVLVAGAGLVVRNFVKLQTAPLGFEARGLMTIGLTPTAARYASAPARAELMRRIVEEVQAAPGVARAAVTTVNPLGGGTWVAPVITESASAVDLNAAVSVNHRLVSPGLFETMGMRVLEGRAFTDADRAGAQMVVIVSDRMARRFWPNSDPIGKRVRIARPNRPWLTVVGVVADVNDSHDPGVPLETWYVPFDQHADTAAAEHVYVMVRSHGDALAPLPAVQRAVARVDGTLAPYDPVAMDSYRANSISRERISALFMLGFGSFGLGLAALGVYGVMAFSVAQRTPEFGIRMALGAGAADILPLVLARSAMLVGIGLAIGVAVALVLNRVLASLLTEVGSVDIAILTGAGVTIVVTAATACFLPALAATRLDPVQALRAE
jgi:putative ABC transport system permease protein